jgi:hypothetical protein
MLKPPPCSGLYVQLARWVRWRGLVPTTLDDVITPVMED